mmetsp:Transcript_70575/g.133129  ORF Transcript_70575/g.133129 Transcript_70575/m.133129 type:complete len:287 (+) Transcript_70575:1-861(+)
MDEKALEIILPSAIGGGLAVAGAAAGIAVGVNQYNKKKAGEATVTTGPPTAAPATTGFLAMAAKEAAPGAPPPVAAKADVEEPKRGVTGSSLPTNMAWSLCAIIGAFIVCGGCACLLARSFLAEGSQKKKTRSATREAKGVAEAMPAETSKTSADLEVVPLLQPYSQPPSRPGSINTVSPPLTAPVVRVTQMPPTPAGTISPMSPAPSMTPASTFILNRGVAATSFSPMQVQQVVAQPASPNASVVLSAASTPLAGSTSAPLGSVILQAVPTAVSSQPSQLYVRPS